MSDVQKNTTNDANKEFVKDQRLKFGFTDPEALKAMILLVEIEEQCDGMQKEHLTFLRDLRKMILDLNQLDSAVDEVIAERELHKYKFDAASLQEVFLLSQYFHLEFRNGIGGVYFRSPMDLLQVRNQVESIGLQRSMIQLSNIQ